MRRKYYEGITAMNYIYNIQHARVVDIMGAAVASST